MDTVKKVVHILSLIIYGLVSIYVVICIPMIFKYKPLVVLTGSMEPSFKVGSIVYYKRTNIKDLKVGECVKDMDYEDNDYEGVYIMRVA